MHPDLAALLALQEKDLAVTAADAALAALEPELRALDEALAAVERQLEAAQRGIADAQNRRGTLEGKIASYKTMQDQRRQRLEWVKGAKEASTLMAELDLARTVLAKEEAEFMRSGDLVTESERRAAEAEKAVEDLREMQRPQREAVAGRKQLVITHSEIFPGTFASTTQTTDYLIASLGLKRQPVLKWGPGGMQQLSEARAGKLRILGFAGNTAPDHIDHFHGLKQWLKLVK